jgi:hypothetical protein
MCPLRLYYLYYVVPPRVPEAQRRAPHTVLSCFIPSLLPGEPLSSLDCQWHVLSLPHSAPSVPGLGAWLHASEGRLDSIFRVGRALLNITLRYWCRMLDALLKALVTILPVSRPSSTPDKPSYASFHTIYSRVDACMAWFSQYTTRFPPQAITHIHPEDTNARSKGAHDGRRPLEPRPSYGNNMLRRCFLPTSPYK